MSDQVSAQNPNPELKKGWFTSLTSLRAAHTDLLRRYREQDNEPELMAEIDHLIRRGCATGAILDNEDDRWAAQGLLDYWSSILYRAGWEPPDTTLVDFDSSLAPDLSEELCPYLGLEAFRTEKRHLFFGQERLLDKLVKHLDTYPLLIVVGASGSGKSSAVLGGLLPRLMTGALPGSQNWAYYSPLVPGSNPLSALAKRFKPIQIGMDEWISENVQAFQQNSFHLTELVKQPDGQPVVLVIDQFEEVFTLCRDDSIRDALVQNLLNFIQTQDAKNRLILTMRTDFESQFVRMPELQAFFEISHTRTTALDANELREAIERPAALVGLKFEEGLVDQLLSDVLGEPAALPLLQFTLLKLWDHREHNRVTWEAYRRLGGGRQALAKSADEFYNSLILEEQVTMKRILLRMVRPSEGLEVTSRRISVRDLYRSGEAKDRVDRVLEKLIQARLVRLTEGDTPDDAQVEMAHEALIRNWPRLVEWLEDERIVLRQRLRLTAAAEHWQNSKREPSALLRGALLEESRSYDDLSDLEAEYIQASRWSEIRKRSFAIVILVGTLLSLSTISAIALREANLASQAKELAQAKTKDAERQRAEAERQRTEAERQRAKAEKRQAEAAKAAELLKQAQEDLEKALNMEAQGRQQAEEQRRIAQAQEKIAIAQRTIAQKNSREAEGQKAIANIFEASARARNWFSTRDASLGLTLAIATTDRSRRTSPQDTLLVAASSLLTGVQTAQEQNRLQSDQGPIFSLAMSQDGQRIISGSEDGTVRLWNTITGEPIGPPLQGHEGTVRSVAISRDGQRIVSGGSDDTVRLWDAATGEPIGSPLQGHEGTVRSVAISRDGQRIVSGSEDGTVRLWDAATGEPIGLPLQGHEGTVRSVAISRDGQRIVSGSEDGTVRLWDAVSGALIGQPLQGHEGSVSSVAMSRDGQRIVSGSEDGTVRLWDAVSGALIGQPLQGHEGSVLSVAISRDGQQIVSGSEDSTVRLWDALSGAPIGQPLQGHTGWVFSVAISPNGQQIVSSSEDATARIWDMVTEQFVSELQQKVNAGIIRAMAISPDGQLIVNGSSDGKVQLWDAVTGEQIGSLLEEHESPISSVAISRDSQRIVSGDSDGIVRLWDTVSGMQIGSPLRGHEGPVRAVAISRDGQRIVSGSADGTVRLWDAVSGAPIGQPLQGHTGSVLSVTISPDGQRIVSGGSDTTVRLWDAVTRSQIGQPLQGHTGSVLSVAISPDGQRIVSGGSDTTVRLWDSVTGSQIGQPLQGHTGWVLSVAISPDGQRIVSGSEDTTVRLWNTVTRQPIGQPLQGHKRNVLSVAISEDGQRIVSSNSDAVVRIWEGSWIGWMRLACERLQYHPLLNAPSTVLSDQALINDAQEAKFACDSRPWSQVTESTSELSWWGSTMSWLTQLWS
ncbi:MAG: hypothetical protein AAGI69_27720 [Cyanobacteria bacterium P01_H01_bin.21]